MYFFYLVLALYPDVQAKARFEVVGRDRLPTFEDKDKIPYLEALTKEVMRWHIIGPMGSVSNATLEDSVHDGYFARKGEIVIANIWCVPSLHSGCPLALVK